MSDEPSKTLEAGLLPCRASELPHGHGVRALVRLRRVLCHSLVAAADIVPCCPKRSASHEPGGDTEVRKAPWRWTLMEYRWLSRRA